MYISRASNFRDLCKIRKLNTREFLELPITMILSAQNINSSARYAIFLVLYNVNNNTGRISIITFV